MMATERRRRRSNDPTQALVYQLDACRRRAGLDAMILADQDGLCIATAGRAETCEEFAARVPLMQRGVQRFASEVWTDEDRWDVDVCRFDLNGMELSLCAVGGMADERAQELACSLQGVTRILAA